MGTAAVNAVEFYVAAGAVLVLSLWAVCALGGRR